MDLTVIIIAHYSKFLLKNLLINIEDKVKYSEILIVNNSTEDLYTIAFEFPFVKIFTIPNNGYGDAINFAVKEAKCNNLLILNPDIVIENFSFPKLDISNFVMGGVKNKQFNFHPKWPNIYNSILTFLLVKISYLLGKPFFRLYYTKTIFEKGVAQVNWVYGDFILSNKQTFEKLDYFDSSFFLFYEETDFCKRANKMNIPVFKCKEIVYRDIDKLKSSSIKVDDIKMKEELKSVFLYFQKHFSHCSANLLKFILTFSYSIYCIIFFCLSILGKKFFKKYNEFKFRLSILEKIKI